MDIFEQYAPDDKCAPDNCTLKEYRKKYAAAEHHKMIRTYAIIGYVLCGINAVMGLLGNIFVLVEMAVLLGLLLGIHVGKSKACAVALLVYAIVNCVIMLISTGTPGGWVWLILGFGFLSVFKKIDREYKSAMNPTSPMDTDMFQTLDE